MKEKMLKIEKCYKIFWKKVFFNYFPEYQWWGNQLSSDCNWTRTQNHLVCKQTLNHLAKLAKWLSCVLSTYLYGAFNSMFLSCHGRVPEWRLSRERFKFNKKVMTPFQLKSFSYFFFLFCLINYNIIMRSICKLTLKATVAVNKILETGDFNSSLPGIPWYTKSPLCIELKIYF